MVGLIFKLLWWVYLYDVRFKKNRRVLTFDVSMMLNLLFRVHEYNHPNVW